MSLTDDMLILERPHTLAGGEGVQRIYRLPNGYSLSLVNNPVLHRYRFAWEGAVFEPGPDGTGFGGLAYDTPLTDDVAVFSNDKEANAWIATAKRWAAARK